jgi:tRNA G18 (ribose-2'-O)-methylase SpoU
MLKSPTTESFIINSFNVHDSLKNLSKKEIQDFYLNNSNHAAVAMTHIEHDFNLSNIIRTANFLGFGEVFYIGGKKNWDRRGAVGTHNYIPVNYCSSYEEFFKVVAGKYIPIALENNIVKNPINIFEYMWPINPVIICGEEQNGIPLEMLEHIVTCLEIPAKGTVRSMNVATAAGIAMSLYSKSI